jgi:hypothetical protein
MKGVTGRSFRIRKSFKRRKQKLYFKISPHKTIRAHTISTDLIFSTFKKYVSWDTIPIKRCLFYVGRGDLLATKLGLFLSRL